MSTVQQRLFRRELAESEPDYSDFTQTFEGPPAAMPPAEKKNSTDAATAITVSAAAQVMDARNPTREAPSQGVKTWLGVGTRDHHVLPMPDNPGNPYASPDLTSAGKAAPKATLAQKVSTDIRGPSTTGPVDGVYQWPNPAPAPAPLPGPHPPKAAVPAGKGLL